MQRQIERLKNYIETFPDVEIWIISGNNRCAELYWERISGYIQTNKKPLIVSKGNYQKDGYSARNAMILLCGPWYKNPIAFSDIFKMRLQEARFTFPIDDFPEPVDLVQNEGMNHRKVLEDQIETLQGIQKIISNQCSKGLSVMDGADRSCEIAKIIESLSATAYKLRKFGK